MFVTQKYSAQSTPHTSELQKYSADDIKKYSSQKIKIVMADLPDQTGIEAALGCLGLSGELFIVYCMHEFECQ